MSPDPEIASRLRLMPGNGSPKQEAIALKLLTFPWIAHTLSRQFLPVFLLVSIPALAQRASGGPTPFRPSPAGPGPNTELVNGRQAAAREVLFQFRDGFLAAVNPQQMATTIADLRKEADAEEFEMLSGSGILRIRSRSRNTDSLVRRLSQRGDVLYAEPNYVVQVVSEANFAAAAAPPPTNDPRFGELWGLHNTGQGVIPGIPGADIDAVKAWTMTTGSTANVVAVIDTGVDYNHADLAANMWRAPAAFTVTVAAQTITCAAGTRGFNAITNSCDPMDDQNHGTHVAGTIGAVGNNAVGVAGVSRTTRIMALKFLDANGYGNIANAIKAIDFAVQVKARFAATNGANIRVLNNSWGGDGYSQALADAIRRANAADMLFVAAAGNDWRDIDFWPTYPASYKEANVLTVAATDNSDLKASFSNYGAKTVHLAAPGDNILSTVRGGQYAFFSGTSMATPHVAGAAALVLSSCSLDTFRLKDVLIRSGDKLSSLNGVTMTGARLNVATAVAGCTAPYYTMTAAPVEVTIPPGSSKTYTVTITPFKAYAGNVTMSVTGLPPGVTAAFQPAVVNMAGVAKTTILTLNVPLTVLPGVHQFTINGVSSTQDRTATAFARVPGYTLTDLGTLPVPVGQRHVEAQHINNTGQIAGYANTQPAGYYTAFNHAFLYSGGAMRDLGAVGGEISSASGIGNGGHVVGHSLNSAGYSRAFVWLNGRMQDLGTLAGYTESFALGVNDSGHVVGYLGNFSTSERAFMKTTGGLQALGTLGGSKSRATAINNLGQVVGYSEKTLYTDHAFLYTGGTMRDLGTIGNNPSGVSRAMDINDKGQVAGFSTVGQDVLTVHACIWANGTVKDLGTMPGFLYTYGKSINASGQVVGFMAPVDDSIAGDAKRAFLYRDDRMLDLNDAIPLNSGWVLLQANSINDNGNITGLGLYNNEVRAFLLAPLR